jgi:hypothetical protein
MKQLFLILFVLISISSIAQNGIFVSERFEFVNKNEPFKNREEFVPKKLIINITELHGEFVKGSILWDISEGGDDSEYIEFELTRIKNSSFDQESSSFIKCYESNMKILDQIIDHADVFIIKNVQNNDLRVDVFNRIKNTINRFDKLHKI